MKENVFDVLIYLFENYMDDGPEFHPDQETLTTELSQAGFARGDIAKAFSWLAQLGTPREDSASFARAPAPGTVRHYSEPECSKLDRVCRGFLLQLEQRGALDAASRELIIDRVMALELEDVTLEQLKWVALMVLVHRRDQERAPALLEDLVFGEEEALAH